MEALPGVRDVPPAHLQAGGSAANDSQPTAATRGDPLPEAPSPIGTGLAHQPHVPRRTRLLQYTLGVLLAFVALNAFGGGYYGLAGAVGVPREWLANSPFSDYVIPSLILMFGVGGTFLGAAFAVFAGLPSARRLSAAAGVVVILWIAAQVVIIGPVSWLQPVMLLVGATVFILARELPVPSEP
jgi:hypothetical protein